MDITPIIKYDPEAPIQRGCRAIRGGRGGPGDRGSRFAGSTVSARPQLAGVTGPDGFGQQAGTSDEASDVSEGAGPSGRQQL